MHYIGRHHASSHPHAVAIRTIDESAGVLGNRRRNLPLLQQLLQYWSNDLSEHNSGKVWPCAGHVGGPAFADKLANTTKSLQATRSEQAHHAY